MNGIQEVGGSIPPGSTNSHIGKTKTPEKSMLAQRPFPFRFRRGALNSPRKKSERQTFGFFLGLRSFPSPHRAAPHVIRFSFHLRCRDGKYRDGFADGYPDGPQAIRDVSFRIIPIRLNRNQNPGYGYCGFCTLLPHGRACRRGTGPAMNFFYAFCRRLSR